LVCAKKRAGTGTTTEHTEGCIVRGTSGLGHESRSWLNRRDHQTGTPTTSRFPSIGRPGLIAFSFEGVKAIPKEEVKILCS
jgi:hypothetical protein